MSDAGDTVLLDANVLIASALVDHVHHEHASRWRASLSPLRFATCPITQGAFIRVSLRQGAPREGAVALLTAVCGQPGHEFWPDDLAYADIDLRPVLGHRQVTDAYLAALARAHGGRLATFDAGLAALHPDIADLVPAVG